MSAPAYYCVASDLHVGDSGPREDFAHEREFQGLLDHTAREGRARGGHAELILAGDVFDFLQIEPLGAGPWRGAIAKLRRAAAAHPAFFESLGRFAAAGHRIVMLPGNHDVELAFADVQAEVVALVSGGDAVVAARVVFPNDEPLGPHFRGWGRGPFAYRLPGVYIEHGNQLDPVNAFDHRDFFEDAAAERIRLVWGSRFVNDLLNEVEGRYPFIDKLRPRAAALLILWLLDAELVRRRLPVLASLGGRLFPELRRWHRAEHGIVGAGAKGGEPGELDPDQALLAWLGAHARDLEIVHEGRVLLRASGAEGSKGSPALPERLSQAYAAIFRAALDLLTSTADDPSRDDGYADRALDLAAAEGAEIAVLGHTHGLRDIRRGDRRYLNTGTWIGLVDLDRRALRDAGPIEYRALLERLRSPGAFIPLQQLSFVELAYPHGRLEARLRVFRDGAARAVSAP
jgi:UDP-2,3-diacylglucosamine pyrophosphatase LpxH